MSGTQLDVVLTVLETLEKVNQDLKFVMFQHPHVPAFIRTLNRDGVPGLLTLANQQLTLDPGGAQPDDGEKLFDTYAPTNNVARPGPKADIDFEADGAYALYNWELFFYAPMLIAERLLQEQRFDQARRWLQYVFDPTSNEPGATTPQRFWRFRPFYDNKDNTRVQEMLELLSYKGNDPAMKARREAVQDQITEWLAHPFEPHRIARLRLAAYQKNVVQRFVTYCVEEGDAQFRRDTIESINQATQLYLLAASILGPRPPKVPATVAVKPNTYQELVKDLDAFANAAVEIENDIFPFASQSATDLVGIGAEQILAAGHTLYFCTPTNEEILGLWDHVEDRLFKIRNCLNIEGVARSLALFEPPIDPAALVRAAAAGVDLDSVLGEVYAPLPHYRFSTLVRAANEVAAEVRALGAQLLAALEKRDAEHLSRIRAVQETALLTAITTTRQRQIDEATAAKLALEKQKAVTAERLAFYANIARTTDKEDEQISRLERAQTLQEIANFADLVGAAIGAVPDFMAGTAGAWGSPFLTVGTGGMRGVAIAHAAARVAGWMSGYEAYKANMAAIKGGHERRWDDWKLQERLATMEVQQIDQQIAAAQLRIDVVTAELASHELQLAHSAETEEYLRTKYTNTELYGWMLGQLSALYFQAYKLAYDLGKRAERAYRFERGVDISNFIQFGYWDGLHKGLLAGERLTLDLRRMDAAYLDANRREYELTRRVSLVLHDPAALVVLKSTGRCEVEVPEELFDADHPGHYFRRIKSVSLTIPCVTGPYTNVNCTLTLLENRVRVSSSAASTYHYDPTKPADPRFRRDFASVQSIATSHANNDAGLFELSFRDERYLPFEGAGAISRWRIDLPIDNNAWDLDTISDIIIKIDYTAREGGELLRKDARDALQETIIKAPGTPGAITPPLQRLFSARHEFSNAWHRFRHPDSPGGAHRLTLPIAVEHYPYPLRGRTLEIGSMDLYVWTDELKNPVPVKVLLPPGGSSAQMTVPLPDGSSATVPLTISPAKAGDAVPLPQTHLTDLGTQQATGDWVVEIPTGALPAKVDDLVLVFTYRVKP